MHFKNSTQLPLLRGLRRPCLAGLGIGRMWLLCSSCAVSLARHITSLQRYTLGADSGIGYETVIRSSSPFCAIFSQQDMENFEYSQDLYYFYMLGSHNRWAAALVCIFILLLRDSLWAESSCLSQGIPWLQIAVDKLNQTASQPLGSHPVPTPTLLPTPSSDLYEEEEKDEATSKLPKPSQGPNATLSQPLHVWFTHREEVPLVTHALDLFHGHDEESAEMPLDRINPSRAWRTSEIIPFLGHVALERMQCDERVTATTTKSPRDRRPRTKPFVRIIVNGSPQMQPMCHDGPGGSCPLEEFADIVRDLPNTYGDLETICLVDKGGK